MTEFVAPDFVQDNDVETIHERMMEALPEDIDDMPGGIPYDFTMPTALQKSELIEFHLVRTLQIMFPQFAWGEWLDLHGQQAGLTRKEPGYASGTVTITGDPGTAIRKGFGVCTQGTEDVPAIVFYTSDYAMIPEEGACEVPILAENPGMEGNVLEGTIVLMLEPIKGISSVTNMSKITGGTDEETDEAFCLRINEANESGGSYIGNDSDYKRWAKEVVGIGDCIVVGAWDGPGTVKLALIDSNGQPANPYLAAAVYNHIVSPDDRSKRILPVGVELTVIGADTKLISYSCGNLSFDDTTNLEQIIEDFKEALIVYYVAAKESSLVRYNHTYSILTNIKGVIDFTDFKMNGATDNITLDGYEYAATDVIDFKD